MIVDDFHVVGISVSPSEADAPLVVDTDAELPGAIALQRFQPVGRRGAQVRELDCGVQHIQLAECGTLQLRAEPLGATALKQRFGLAVGKIRDHTADNSACR